jgi:hypothetical protein
MDPSVKAVQDLLDQMARQLVRYANDHELSAKHYQRLIKFVFGCMNQKNELPSRFAKRGSSEFDKVLRFIAAVAEVLLEIDRESGA